MENTQGSGGTPQKQSNGVGTAGFVLALIALFLGWVPVLGWLSWFLGLVLSFAGIFKNPKGLAIAGLVISLIEATLLLTVYASIMSAVGLFGLLGL